MGARGARTGTAQNVMIDKLGFFHLAVGHATPLLSLNKALEKPEGCTLPGSLVVLPEAFNIGREYLSDKGTASDSPDVCESLKRLAHEFQVTFVAGLVIRDNTDPQEKPLNSAYLIDRSSAARISSKSTADRDFFRAAGPALLPTEFVRVENLRVVSFLCWDVDKNDLLARVKPEPPDPCFARVIAVPASGTMLFPNRGPEKLGLEFDYLVMANSHPAGRSFVARGSSIIKEHKDSNVVSLVSVA